VITKNSNQNIL